MLHFSDLNDWTPCSLIWKFIINKVDERRERKCSYTYFFPSCVSQSISNNTQQTDWFGLNFISTSSVYFSCTVWCHVIRITISGVNAFRRRFALYLFTLQPDVYSLRNIYIAGNESSSFRSCANRAILALLSKIPSGL